MLFSKKALGLEICHDGARIALVEGRKAAPLLAAFGSASFPADTMRFSMRESNVLNPAAFVAAIRELHLRLLTKVRRVSVSLPDATGRAMLLDVETRFRSRQEGIDIIRWKLKKNFPFDINEIHLDYQVAGVGETGEITLLVALISRQVVRQYEDLLLEAGLEADQIDFTTFNLYRLFAQRLELAESSTLITCHGGSLGVLIFHDGRLEFCRVKELSAGSLEPNRVFREINSSFLVFKEKYPAHIPTEAFCVHTGDDTEAFCALIAEATGLEPVLLDVERAVDRGNSSSPDKKTLRTLASALGAAARSL
ncbi:MAG TPA: pilus assembly protein PilM [Geobacteraceae bacterium]|nr:pilus assembly protein PilM [Geobacteraceae bacterium]